MKHLKDYLRFCFWFFLLVCYQNLVYGQALDPQKVKQTLTNLSKLRGIQLTQEPLLQIIDKQDFEGYIRTRIIEEYGLEDIEYENRFLKTFQLMPIEENLLDLFSKISGQAATAFYDPKKNKMVFHQNSAIEPTVVLHESVHALQSLGLGTKDWLDHSMYDLDEQLAHQSFLEGDAMVMMLWQADQSTSINLQRIGLFAQQIASSISRRYQNISPYLANQLAFPYLYGTRFVMYFLHKGWGFDQINALYQIPPISTQEIYRPSLYEQRIQEQLTDKATDKATAQRLISKSSRFESLKDKFKDLKDLKHLKPLKLKWFNRGGQWHCEAFLAERMPIHESKEACRGWVNDEVYLFEQSDGKALICMLYQLNSAFDRLNLEKAIEKWNEISKLHLKMKANHQELAFCISDQGDEHTIDLTSFFSK